jgi:hypothetical protein
MKNTYVQLTQRLFVLVIFMFLLGISQSYAQIGPLGIYGSAPESIRPYVRYVRLDFYPCTGCRTILIAPLNGLKNFNIYYTADGMGFLSGGGYKLTYVDASLTTSYGYDIVTYSPNVGHTNGVQVRPFNIPPPFPTSPRGIHGIVNGYNAGGSIVPLHDLTVLGSLGSDSQYTKTNGDGYFSLYYSYAIPIGFLGAGDHRTLYITGGQDGCYYSYTLSGANVLWSPDTDPNSSSYYVSGAEMDLAGLIPTLPCQ